MSGSSSTSAPVKRGRPSKTNMLTNVVSEQTKHIVESSKEGIDYLANAIKRLARPTL